MVITTSIFEKQPKRSPAPTVVQKVYLPKLSTTILRLPNNLDITKIFDQEFRKTGELSDNAKEYISDKLKSFLNIPGVVLNCEKRKEELLTEITLTKKQLLEIDAKIDGIHNGIIQGSSDKKKIKKLLSTLNKHGYFKSKKISLQELKFLKLDLERTISKTWNPFKKYQLKKLIKSINECEPILSDVKRLHYSGYSKSLEFIGHQQAKLILNNLIKDKANNLEILSKQLNDLELKPSIKNDTKEQFRLYLSLISNINELTGLTNFEKSKITELMVNEGISFENKQSRKEKITICFNNYKTKKEYSEPWLSLSDYELAKGHQLVFHGNTSPNIPSNLATLSLNGDDGPGVYTARNPHRSSYYAKMGSSLFNNKLAGSYVHALDIDIDDKHLVKDGIFSEEQKIRITDICNSKNFDSSLILKDFYNPKSLYFSKEIIDQIFDILDEADIRATSSNTNDKDDIIIFRPDKYVKVLATFEILPPLKPEATLYQNGVDPNTLSAEGFYSLYKQIWSNNSYGSELPEKYETQLIRQINRREVDSITVRNIKNEGGYIVDEVLIEGQKWIKKSVEIRHDPRINEERFYQYEREHAAFQIYKLLGVQVPESFLDRNGNLYKEFIEAGSGDINKLKNTAIIDIFLANWDVIGIDNQNIIINREGIPIRIDCDGALDFSARGSKKDLYELTLGLEIETMRDLSNPTGAIFHTISDQDLALQFKTIIEPKIEDIIRLIPDDIKPIFEKRFESFKRWSDKFI